MNRHHYLEAIETVLSWDLPEEALTNAINQQFKREVDFDDVWNCYSTRSETFH